MSNVLDIQKRIKSVKNIAQVTRALEAVSASRVRRAQSRAAATRMYAEKAWEILLNVQSTSQGGVPMHPLLTQRESVDKIRVVLITSDRGLAGSYNANIIRAANRFQSRADAPVEFITVGQKGRDAMIRDEEDVVAEFSNLPSEPGVSDIAPIARAAIDDFLSGEIDEVFVAYTDFINTLTQKPVVQRVLPLVPYETDDQALAEYVKDVPDVTGGMSEYEFEPDPSSVLDEIVPRFVELQLYQAVLESLASEHAARMVAMKNASDNASELVEDLTLEYNKARQTAITNEILDIVGGAEAMQASIDATAKEIEKASEKQKNRSAQLYRDNVSNGNAVAADDLTKIEGIGKKTGQALIDAGIRTFGRLASSNETELREILKAAGLNFTPSVETWAEQAKYAADGDWDGLKEFQDTLVAGRRPQSD